MQPYDATPRTRQSKTALTGFIISLFFCIPVLPSLTGTVLGFVGIRKTSDPLLAGRGLAIAALVIGIVGLLGWSAIGYGSWRFYVNSEQPRLAARAFIEDVAAGDVAAAQAKALPAMPLEDLRQGVEHLQTKGTLSEINVLQLHSSWNNGVTNWTFGGQLNWVDGSSSAFEIVLRDAPDDTWLVQTFWFE
jgi:hypothetical protein